MALWMQISQKLPYFPSEAVTKLYPAETFPIDVRHYLASWIEEQRWYRFILSLLLVMKKCANQRMIICVLGLREDFDVDNLEQAPQALQLLERMMELLQEVAFQNPNVVEKVKLQHICRSMVVTLLLPLSFKKNRSMVIFIKYKSNINLVFK